MGLRNAAHRNGHPPPRAQSPFDSNARRHTSFTSVYVYPEVDDSIEIEINPADLKVDVFRASGAGGQHIQKTESAVRIHHVPTGIITICQDDRSQHRNREKAMQQLKAKLYELEMRKRMEAQNKLEESKSDIGWGSPDPQLRPGPVPREGPPHERGNRQHRRRSRRRFGPVHRGESLLGIGPKAE